MNIHQKQRNMKRNQSIFTVYCFHLHTDIRVCVGGDVFPTNLLDLYFIKDSTNDPVLGHTYTHTNSELNVCRQFYWIVLATF